MKRVGKVIKIGGLNVWPHEQLMADILAAAGHVVEFLPATDKKGSYTPDVLLDGVRWEFKSPKSAKIDAIERNLKRGTRQSVRLVISSHRIKRLPDKAIEREITIKMRANKKLEAVKFINRHGKIIDIS
jgi:hypothetical protein